MRVHKMDAHQFIDERSSQHEQWAHWIKYMLDNLTSENIERWKQQATIPYSDLSEKEKESDRVWADKVLALMRW